ncbi:hypothetical protein BGX24_011960 [Mortierella sp. AD032]|nr:hypothetical protein BGX24_011960 [Mortierella sp. AD032]
MNAEHLTYYTNRCLRRLAMLDSEEAHLLLNLKTPHISSTINHPRDRECLRIVRETILELELSLHLLYPHLPNKIDNTRSKRQRKTNQQQTGATDQQQQQQHQQQLLISPCDMSQRYKRKLNILDEEEQEFLGWGHKQDSTGLATCRQLIRKYETALVDFMQVQASVGPVLDEK